MFYSAVVAKVPVTTFFVCAQRVCFASDSLFTASHLIVFLKQQQHELQLEYLTTSSSQMGAITHNSVFQ
jgi:hypothetical protein